MAARNEESRAAAAILRTRDLLVRQGTRLINALRGPMGEFGLVVPQGAARARENETAPRLMAIPGAGPLIARALVALAPAPRTFRRGRDFAAWLGLTPRQHSTGGKPRPGAATRMGERSLRRLLIISASSAVIRRGVHKATQPGTWLAGLLSRKPPMLVRVAPASRMARIMWALVSKAEADRAPAMAA